MKTKCECEYLFCFAQAAARFTAPHLKPRMFVCEQHLAESLEWTKDYRKVGGAVQVEQV